ncbi:GNAT family N-acetyltransferase [Alloalcanivorax xenomutans]|uniref:GNAT family N-acetyltransferase n=1 Tax=Alloalcanivorax xenomutans TaxID=1094342 RepID=UPI003D9AD6F5
MSACLVSSITEYCYADHQGRTDVLKSWTGNKTPQNTLSWLNSAKNHIVVAVPHGKDYVVGVGLLSDDEISLCYVRHGYANKGVGRLIMSNLELKAAATGISRVHLWSTITAKPFYEKLGYLQRGRPIHIAGLEGSRYEKDL